MTNKDGSDEIFIIEDSEVNKQISPLETGVFTQFTHFIPGIQSAYLQIPGVLTNAKLFYTSTLATVLPARNNSLSFNNTSFNFSSDIQNRDLIIAAGSQTQTDIFSVKSPPMEYDDGSSKERVINACKEQQYITVYTKKEDADSSRNSIADGVMYGKAQNNPFYSIQTLERNTGLFFYETQAHASIQIIPDISFVNGKSYSIIFGGSLHTNDASTNGYSIILIQEY